MRMNVNTKGRFHGRLGASLAEAAVTYIRMCHMRKGCREAESESPASRISTLSVYTSGVILSGALKASARKKRSDY